MNSLILTGAFAIGLLVAPVAGGAATGIGAVAAAILIAALSIVYGATILRLLGVRPGSEVMPACIAVAGFTAVSLVHLTATAILNVGVMPALIVDLAGAVVLVWATGGARTSIEWSRDPRDAASLWLDAAVVVACAVFVTAWARETVMAVPRAQATGVFRAWQDFLLHASEITYLRDYPAFDTRSQYLTAIPQPLYHRASYAMSAVFSALSGASSFATATAFWLPTGLLLCVVATYALGTALGGRRAAGFGAVAIVFMLPDASTYGFHNRFLSVHWLLQMAGGSGYAVAATLLGLIAVVTSMPRERGRALVAASIFVAAGAVFRMHVGVLAGGMVAILIASAQKPRLSARRVLVFLAVVVCAAAAAVYLESVTLAPHMLSRTAHPIDFIQSVHQQASAIPTPPTAWIAGYGDFWKFVLGYALLLVAGGGVLLPLWLALWMTGTFKAMGWRAAAIPVALLISHIAVILILPVPAHGDPTDWGHRPFVLIYIILGAMSGAALAAALITSSAHHFGHVRAGIAVLLALGAAGSWAAWTAGRDLQQRWWPPYATIPISREAFGAGAFVRERSSPGDQVLAASEDPLAIFVALTERAAYLSRVDLYRSLGSETAARADERAAAHATLRQISGFDELQQFGRLHGIAWYIADNARTHAWPAGLTQRCAYCGETIRVYDLR